MRNRNTLYITLLAILTVMLAAISLYYGSVSIPASAVTDILCGGEAEKTSWAYIVLQSRVPQTTTAILTGAALAVSGLMLQTVFNNPLADSSILGISAGSSLGAALVILGMGGSIAVSTVNFGGFLSVIAGAMTGAFAIMAFILFLSTLIKNNVMLLIAGIMTGYVTSSAISLLNFFSTAEGVHSYITWGMGNFGGVSLTQLPAFASMIIIGLAISVMLIKPMNALLLGTRYAENLGVNIRRTRNLLLLSTGILTAVTTAFCGPVSFIGLAVPHIARLLLGTSNHNSLLLATALCGAAMALLCSIVSILPSENGIIPINAVTPVLGAPVIIYVIINQKKIQYFN